MAKAKSSWRASNLNIIFSVLLVFTLGYVVTTLLWDRPRRYQIRSPRSPLASYTGHGGQASLPPSIRGGLATESQGSAGEPQNTSKESIKWKLYGVELMSDEARRSILHESLPTVQYVEDSGVSAQRHNASEDDFISKSFQEQIHVGTPLYCHTGEEGLISVKYERFLRSLVNYTSFHQNSGGSNTRTLVWHCPRLKHCGGLADRLKGITYTLLLAIFSRRRLILNWGGLERTFLTPNLIDWTDGPVFNETLDKDEMKQQYPVFHLMDGGDHVNSKGEDIKVTFETLGNDETVHVLLVTNSKPRSLQSTVKTAHQKWILNGLRQTGLDSLSPDELDNVVGIVFRYLFQTKPELLEEVARARNVLGLDDRPYTAVHIRSGFAGSSHSLEAQKNPKLIKDKSVWEAMLKCGLSTADTLLGNSSLLFLATDSMLVKHLAVSKYGARFRTLDNSLVHVDHLKFTRKRTGLNEKEGVLVGLVEFILLAEAYSHVRGFSGYSWAAGLLCSLPGERVIDGLKCVPESQVKRYGCSGGPYCVRYIN